MAEEIEKVRKAEHRTRSEFAREAFRTYIEVHRRTYTPTAAELRAIEKGRAAFRRGEGLTLDEARAYVERLASKARPQKRRARSQT
jgi:predicted transcriptional regulator